MFAQGASLQKGPVREAPPLLSGPPLVAMAFVPALIPLGVGVAKIIRNVSTDERDSQVQPSTRSRSVVERLTAGATPPVAYWSEQHLERMLKTNSALRDSAEELRSARKAGIGGGRSRPVGTETLMGA